MRGQVIEAPKRSGASVPLETKSKLSPKIDQNQIENPKEEEPSKVQPNIILVLVSVSEKKKLLTNLRISNDY